MVFLLADHRRILIGVRLLMTSLQRFQPNLPSVEELERAFSISRDKAEEYLDIYQTQTYYRNDVYQVTVSLPVSSPFGPVIHLSVLRYDKEPVHSWADMQTIKNQIVGEEFEAVELYPAESRLVDHGAEYHLWVVADKSFRFPLGYLQRDVALCN